MKKQKPRQRFKKTPSHGEPGMEAKALATFADGLAAEAIQY